MMCDWFAIERLGCGVDCPRTKVWWGRGKGTRGGGGGRVVGRREEEEVLERFIYIVLSY
jgi:hypothetical protein